LEKPPRFVVPRKRYFDDSELVKFDFVKTSLHQRALRKENVAYLIAKECGYCSILFLQLSRFAMRKAFPYVRCDNAQQGETLSMVQN
jgi:hypothetical protein